MEYQELELGIAKKLTEKPKRCFNYQMIVNGCLALWMVFCSAGFLFNYYQVQVLHWHLNSTHTRVRELERWQAHMCSVRHYNCPERIETPEYTDDWDWDNFPSMDDYIYDDAGVTPYPNHAQRNKREIVAETTDGVPIYTQPYAEIERLNNTRRRKKVLRPPAPQLETVPILQAGYHNPAWPTSHILKPELKLYQELDGGHTTVTSKPLMTRSSRVMVTPDLPDDSTEQHTKVGPKIKSLETRNYQNQQSDEMNSYGTGRRVHQRRMPTQRQRVAESMEEEANPVVATIVRPTRRYMPAAHYHGDTSKYSLGIHQNYHGNGHLKHADRTYVDWITSDWMKHTNQDGVFDLTNGVMTINEDGLYFVYAQIFYVDDHDLNGYHVYRNQEMILQCTTMTHSTTRVRKSNTCYTAGVEMFNAGDKVYVRDLSNERLSLFEKGKSFFGAMKLSDVRIK